MLLKSLLPLISAWISRLSSCFFRNGWSSFATKRLILTSLSIRCLVFILFGRTSCNIHREQPLLTCRTTIDEVIVTLFFLTLESVPIQMSWEILFLLFWITSFVSSFSNDGTFLPSNLVHCRSKRFFFMMGFMFGCVYDAQSIQNCKTIFVILCLESVSTKGIIGSQQHIITV